ncbi:VWA domain-containing protein [Novosphingobium sp. 1949]|uniref:VWA domain-containing protein n=1 Tax=Novosphingobium organovorum TaxID=2930092 RepID=A0ABT0BI22_9SPHN|nr:VWA domain-containing protein [Novosphingobium organovorum]MCJ2184697.1 VWA domain-containing protein [Novosphingobium organovorum]
MSGEDALRRWRLVLGRYAERALPGAALSNEERRADRALDHLYAREMERRGLRRDTRPRGGGGTLDPSALTTLGWLGELRALFPQSVCETIQAHALTNLGMQDLLDDPAVLDALEPNQDLLKALIAFKGGADPALRAKIREVTRRIVEDIVARLRPRVEAALTGRPDRFRRSTIKSMQSFDWRATIRENLATWDAERATITAEKLRFHARRRRTLPWTIILCVDQSGSMLSSTIYAAVMASILAGLPAVDIRLIVFDTAIVDLSSEAHDPVEVLMAVQLGGGTDIASAMEYAEGLITQPSRTLFVLVSDFEEGGSVTRMLAATRRMASARVTLMGLGALSDEAAPLYDRAMAERLAGCGMQVAALTPEHFAEWIAGVIA